MVRGRPEGRIRDAGDVTYVCGGEVRGYNAAARAEVEMFDPDQAVAYTLGLMVIAFVVWVLAR